MKKVILTLLLLPALLGLQAQKDSKPTKGEKILETIKNLPDELLKQPETAPDTNANKLISDNLSFEVPLLWREKGTMSIIEYKLQKCDVDPLKETFPLPDKKLVQMVTMNMGTIKKTPDEKKQMILAEIQKHLIAYYKEAGQTISKQEIIDQANTMVISNEPFTTNQGKTGELFFIHDIQTQQAGFSTLLLLPDGSSKTTFVQLTYWHYVYETTFPEDILEWRTFVYPDDQQIYIDFTKKMLKTLVIG